MTREPEVTFAMLMERSRQWGRDHAALMADHAAYRRRLDAAMKSTTKERARSQQAASGK